MPQVKSTLGPAKIGPEISYRFEPKPGFTVEPRPGLQAIWNFAGEMTANGLGVVNGEAAGPQGVRGRAELGLKATTPDARASGIGHWS